MNRRGLIKAASLAPLLALPVILEAPALVWGDGIHDDAPGLQAAFDGRPWRSMSRNVQNIGGAIYARGATFKLGNTLQIHKHSCGSIMKCVFKVVR